MRLRFTRQQRRLSIYNGRLWVFLKIMKAQEIIRSIEAEQLKSNLPQIYVGDSVRVGVIIQEGKERTQPTREW